MEIARPRYSTLLVICQSLNHRIKSLTVSGLGQLGWETKILKPRDLHGKLSSSEDDTPRRDLEQATFLG
jgi:hypothetical protein